MARKPSPVRPGWEFGPEIEPGLGDLAKALFQSLNEARAKVGTNNLIRTERLARTCTKAGLTIEKAALE